MSDASMASSLPFASATARAGAQPIVFHSAGGWCFGWFHPARCTPRGIGRGAVPAVRLRSHLQLTAPTPCWPKHWPTAASTSSASTTTAPATRPAPTPMPTALPAWLASIASAVSELRQRSGVSHVALFGMRLGATLAARAAAELGGVDSLVLWAPCSGRVFTRELRAADAARGGAVPQDGSAGIESLGYLYTAQTLRDLQALDRDDPAVAPARRVLIIGRDDMPASNALAERYRAGGCRDHLRRLAGLCRHDGRAARGADRPRHAACDRAVAGRAGQRRGTADGPGRGARVGRRGGRKRARGCARDAAGVRRREGPVRRPGRAGCAATGRAPRRDGRPDAERGRQSPDRAEPQLCAVCQVAGGGGLPRAAARPGRRRRQPRQRGLFAARSMYSRSSIADVRAAIDSLAERGCKRFYLLGICSGSYVAFQTAMVDARVTGQILMNPRLLEWEGKAGGWDDVMQNYYKSTAFYQRSLLNLNVYWRMARGQVDVNGIARRFRAVIQARLKRCDRPSAGLEVGGGKPVVEVPQPGRPRRRHLDGGRRRGRRARLRGVPFRAARGGTCGRTPISGWCWCPTPITLSRVRAASSSFWPRCANTWTPKPRQPASRRRCTWKTRRWSGRGEARLPGTRSGYLNGCPAARSWFPLPVADNPRRAGRLLAEVGSEKIHEGPHPGRGLMPLRIDRMDVG